MKNTLYVLSDNCKIKLDNNTFIIEKDSNTIDKIPVIHISDIILQGYIPFSIDVLYKCMENNINICILSKHGDFIGNFNSAYVGNVDLRKKQYDYIFCEYKRLVLASNIIVGKINNQISVVSRSLRNNIYSESDEKLINITLDRLNIICEKCMNTSSIEILRGYEGEASRIYFSIFDKLIVKQKDDFKFNGRNRRPPKDSINAMLSYLYAILESNVTSALHATGFDVYAGFIHGDRSGRESLALDIMEELRPIMVDKTVLKLISKHMIHKDDFEYTKDCVLLNDKGKRVVVTEWYNKSKQKVVHPYLNKEITWGEIPLYQCSILARYLRGQIAKYIPYKWR